MNDRKVDISIAIPIYNEEENISELYRRLTSVLKKMENEESFRHTFIFRQY